MKFENIYDVYFNLRFVDEQTYENYQIPHYLNNILPKDKNSRILDIGCGYGQMLMALGKIGYINAQGIDVAPDAVAFCKKNNLQVTKTEGIEDYNPSEKFDLIVMSHVLEHLEKHTVIGTLKYIRENLLKDGGQFLVMVPNAQSNTGAYWMYEDFTHYTLFTSGSLIFVLKAAGFNNVAFLDADGVESAGTWYGKLTRRFFLRLYDMNKSFWNKITLSAYHRKSPRIYSFELKALAK